MRFAVGEDERAGRTWDLLLCELGKMIGLALVRRAAPVPEEEPLQRLATLELVFEAEDVVLVGEFEEVEQFGGGFHDREGWGLRVVD